MKLCCAETSVEELGRRVRTESLPDAALDALAVVGLFPPTTRTGRVLFIPDSITQVTTWDQVGRQMERPVELSASFSMLCRLTHVREHFLGRLMPKPTAKLWSSYEFIELVGAHVDRTEDCSEERISAFESSRASLPDLYRNFDSGLHLACCHFLYKVRSGRKALGMTAAECCLLYMEAIELLDREVKYPGYLSEAALAVGRRLLCDDQWNVVDGHCQLLFRPACEAMIRSIQIAVLESLLSE